ncbi:MAG: GTP cyclohydrolase II [Alphaproteobacteria bacterium]|nr:GTP cyclohydrolase II [Alphaproteobacteria bacterium]
MQENEAHIAHAILATERASDDLRRQLGVVLDQQVALPMEWLDEASLAAFGKKAYLLITPSRAKQFSLPASDKPLRISAKGLTLAQLRHIADPLAEKTALPTLETAPADEADIFVLLLTKQAALLPALLVEACDETPKIFAHFPNLSLSDLKLALRRPLVEVLPITGANLPIEGAEGAELKSFRTRFGTSVHLALVVGEPSSKTAPLVRVHSSCVTGDILGSLRCDCGDQLRLALEAIRADGNGVLIYLHQEGRGIGIGNKLRAYRLQECGMDTYDANLALGFEEDERDFSLAAAILKQLGIGKIRLLTNNPDKITALKASGIVVEERAPLAAPAGKHNHDYLRAKANKSGHLF